MGVALLALARSKGKLDAPKDLLSLAAPEMTSPGRFVCNNLFYRIMTESVAAPRVSGFVHLPFIHTVDAADQAMLKKVVTAAVAAAVAKQKSLN